MGGYGNFCSNCDVDIRYNPDHICDAGRRYPEPQFGGYRNQSGVHSMSSQYGNSSYGSIHGHSSSSHGYSSSGHGPGLGHGAFSSHHGSRHDSKGHNAPASSSQHGHSSSHHGPLGDPYAPSSSSSSKGRTKSSYGGGYDNHSHGRPHLSDGSGDSYGRRNAVDYGAHSMYIGEDELVQALASFGIGVTEIQWMGKAAAVAKLNELERMFGKMNLR